MRKTIISVTIFLIVFIMGTYFMINYSIPKEKSITPPASKSTSSSEEKKNFQSSPSSIVESKIYKVKNHNGNIAVFNSESSEPLKIISVAVEELPPADQELLKKGIEVYSEEELVTILEDYCS